MSFFEFMVYGFAIIGAGKQLPEELQEEEGK